MAKIEKLTSRICKRSSCIPTGAPCTGSIQSEYSLQRVPTIRKTHQNTATSKVFFDYPAGPSFSRHDRREATRLATMGFLGQLFFFTTFIHSPCPSCPDVTRRGDTTPPHLRLYVHWVRYLACPLYYEIPSSAPLRDLGPGPSA